MDIILFGSYGAKVVDFIADMTFSIDTSKSKSPKDPVPLLCRLLLKNRYPPETPIRIVRDGESVFQKERTIQAWADENWVDSQNVGPHKVKYVPFSLRLGQGEALEGGEVQDSPEE